MERFIHINGMFIDRVSSTPAQIKKAFGVSKAKVKKFTTLIFGTSEAVYLTVRFSKEEKNILGNGRYIELQVTAKNKAAAKRLEKMGLIQLKQNSFNTIIKVTHHGRMLNVPTSNGLHVVEGATLQLSK